VGSTLRRLQDILDDPDAGLGYLGRYQLHELIATGGMAEIYLAEDERYRPVVIKRANERVMADPALRTLFVDEARIAAMLDHPGIVRVIDIESAGYDCYYVMEYLHGMDVGALLLSEAARGSRVPLVHSLDIAIAAADALQAAHQARTPDGQPLGIVHRDVSPCNLHVGTDGSVHLLDFGVARTNLRTGTPAGQVKGKFGYMAPEQMWGHPEVRSDIYSLAVVLWEMTTGRRLFATKGVTVAQMLQHRHRVPRPSAVVPDYPKALEAIILRALSADPEERYSSAAELGAALRAFAAERQLPLSKEHLAAYVQRLTTTRGVTSEVDLLPATTAVDLDFGESVVTEVDQVEVAITAAPYTTAALPTASAPSPSRSRWWLWSVGLAAVGLGALAWWV